MRTTPKLLLVSLLFAGSALAQPAATPPSPATPAGGAAPGADVDVSVKQRASLSPPEMLGQGKEYFRVMNETLGHIQTLQETAPAPEGHHQAQLRHRQARAGQGQHQHR